MSGIKSRVKVWLSAGALAVLLAGWLLVASAVSPAYAAPSTPQDALAEPATPIQVDLQIDRLARLGETAALSCVVSAAYDAPGARAAIELPANAELASGALSWQGDLLAGQPVTLNATILFKGSGDTAIACRALRPTEELDTWGDLDTLYLSVGEQETLDGFAPVPLTERDVLGEMESPGQGVVLSQLAAYPASSPSDAPDNAAPAVDAHQKGAEPAVAAVETPLGNLTITGRWRFYNRDGVLDSEQMIIEIVRGDNGNHLAWCYTDAAGYYTCGPFTNPGGVGVRSRYLSYTNFNPYNDILVTVNPDTGTTGSTGNAFAFTTSVQSFADGTHDIGGWSTGSSNNNRRAYWVTNDLIRVWKYIWFQTGSSQSPQETSGQATVQWKIDSTDGTYYSRGGNIHLEGADPLSKTVVGHEYGHNMMWNIYGAWMPTTYCPSPHYIQYASHVNCAWTEGWANFITIAVNNEPVYYWSSGSTLNLETPSWTTSNWDDGDSVEGRVAGGMWDILDAANDGDDTYSDGNLVDIWDTIYHQNDSNYSEYWAAWKSRGHTNTSAGPIMSNYQSTIDYRSGPAHDDYADRIVISAGASAYSHFNVSTGSATTQGNDPATLCGSTLEPRQSRSVWYRITPNTTANYLFDTEGTDYDTVLAIWTGSWGSLTHRGCDDDSGTGLLSSLYRRLNSGTTYTIEVMRYGAGAGGSLDFAMERDSGPYCYDWSGNGRIDSQDIQLTASRFGNTAAGNLQYDVIPDGVINVGDLVEIAGRWNQTCTLSDSLLPLLVELPVEMVKE
jgi:hypothetical protein